MGGLYGLFDDSVLVLRPEYYSDTIGLDITGSRNEFGRDKMIHRNMVEFEVKDAYALFSRPGSGMQCGGTCYPIGDYTELFAQLIQDFKITG